MLACVGLRVGATHLGSKRSACPKHISRWKHSPHVGARLLFWGSEAFRPVPRLGTTFRVHLSVGSVQQHQPRSRSSSDANVLWLTV